MQSLRGITLAATLILLALTLLVPVREARAALPDPVAFGIAMELGNIDAARRWLDEGLDPDMEADRIGTGLMIAAWEGNLPLMELFLARGADLHKVNRHGEQALQLAAWRGRLDAVRFLLERGARVNRDGKEWSALHYAVFAGHDQVARLLLERGADINARTPNESTALMMAAREGHEQLARALVDAGADPTLANDRGDTALSWAMRHGNYHIAKLVSSAEAFAKAVKAPPESFGEAKKSVAAPSEISEALKRIREAEARGQPTAALRTALMQAIERFRKEGAPDDGGSRGKRSAAREQPKLVITASRGGGGERAELVTTPARMSWDYDESKVNELADLMRQLDEAGKAGLPAARVAQLRRAVQQAYRRMKESR